MVEVITRLLLSLGGLVMGLAAVAILAGAFWLVVGGLIALPQAAWDAARRRRNLKKSRPLLVNIAEERASNQLWEELHEQDPAYLAQLGIEEPVYVRRNRELYREVERKAQDRR
jgi:tRNA A37 N6-isopentenylltransferase MiaA